MKPGERWADGHGRLWEMTYDGNPKQILSIEEQLAMMASKRSEIAAELAAKANEYCDLSDGHEEELCRLIRVALDDAFAAGQQHQRDMDSWWK